MTSVQRMARSLARANTLRAMLLVVTGSAGVIASAAIAMQYFDALGALGASSLRLALAAVLLLIIFRPRWRGRSRREWAGIVLYGVAMAAMNSFLYLALDRLPIGVATTIDFLGPCLVALAASRRPREGLLAIAAFIGVGLIAGLGGPFDPLGLVFAALAGASFGLYTLLAARVGQSEGGLPSVALSVLVAAILTLPFSAPTVGRMEPDFWLPMIAAAALGTTLAFTVDTLAGRLTSARVLGVLFAFDPVIGTLVGVFILGQGLTPVALAGIVLVVAAGAGIVWFAGDPSTRTNASARGGRTSDAGPDTDAHAGGYAGGMSASGAAGGVVESFEIERKYEVREGSALPQAAALREAGFHPDAPQTYELHNAYFDTPQGDLARHRLAVRLRRGGPDAGWHLKERTAEGAREWMWPPEEGMPGGLRQRITERIGNAEGLGPLAELRTTRRVMQLRDSTGRETVELVDDRVRAVDRRTGTRRSWSEWEAELAAGADPSLLDALEPVLLAAGATPSLSTAKIARATGSLEALALAAGSGPERIAALRALDAADRAAAEREVESFGDSAPTLDA
ncbi:MAG: EamA family transporter [Leucobacter sp.]